MGGGRQRLKRCLGKTLFAPWLADEGREPAEYYRFIAWYSAFGRISTAEGCRLGMLKKLATEAMSQMSRSLKP